MADPGLTVVVCTHERPRELEHCLSALAALDDDVDVVVVDSASAPSVRPVVERFADRIARLRYVYEREPGLSRARNRGVAVATGELVAFVDDDAAPAPDWARRIAAPFADPGIACVGGSCRPAFEAERPRWLSDRLLQFAGITRFAGAARAARSSAEYPFGANVCFRRTSLLACGGFAERLGRVGTSLLSGEEYEAIEAIRRRGGVVWLEPSAVVDHLVPAARCRSSYYWRRLFWQGVSRARSRRSAAVALRLLAAAPIRLLLWLATRDRFYLFRVAETGGYLRECVAPPPAGR